MLSDVEKGNSLMLTRLTLVATLAQTLEHCFYCKYRILLYLP